MSNQQLARQWRDQVVRPVLFHLRHPYDSPSAIALLCMIGAHESGRFSFLRQVADWQGGQQIYGPARGFLQMEPATEADTWRYLDSRQPAFGDRIRMLQAPLTQITDYGDGSSQLVWNLAYQVAIGRAKLWMAPDPLPAFDDLDCLGAYAKRFWNTSAGVATADDYVRAYRSSFPPSQWDFIP